MNKARYLFERYYNNLPESMDKNIVAYWEKILGDAGMRFVKQMHPEYFFGFLGNSEFEENQQIDTKSETLCRNKAQKDIYEQIVFGEFYAPFVGICVDKIEKYLQECSCINNIEVLGDFERFVLNLLNNICVRTLIFEMHVCVEQGVLKGNNKEQYQNYVSQYLADETYVKDLFQLYPVLERRIKETMDMSVECFSEIMERLEKDGKEICLRFNIEYQNYRVKHLHTGFSDAHRNGKRVFRVELENGYSFFYKPRSLKNEEELQNIINFFYKECDCKVYSYFIIDKGDYGWCEAVHQRDCVDEDELRRYYERIGIILFINYLFEGGDIHYENLIALGEYPVIIDAETFIGNITRNSAVKSATERITNLLKKSVLYSGILPFYAWGDTGESGINMSAISGIENQKYPVKIPAIIDAKTSKMRITYINPRSQKNKNLALLNGEFVPPAIYADKIVSGFQKAYICAMNCQDKLIEMIESYRKLQVRHLARNTQQYTITLGSSHHPELLMDGGARNLFFYSLANSIQEKRNEQLIDDEILDLLNGDVPYFYYECGSNSLYSSRKREIRNFFEKSAIERLKENILGLSVDDMEQQIHYINVTFNMVDAGNKKIANSAIGIVNGKREINVESIIHKLVEKIAKSAIYNENQTDVNWIGVKLIGVKENEWMIQPLSSILYDGRNGIDILFHAYKSTFQTEKYDEIIRILDKQIFQYINSVKSKKISIKKSVSGVFSGEGSILYALSVIYQMSRDVKYKFYFDEWLKCMESLIQEDVEFDIISGNAGVLLVLLNMYKTTKEQIYLQKAKEIAELLLGKISKDKEIVGWKPKSVSKVLAGFAHGNSGFIEVFSRLYEVVPDDRYLNVIKGLIEYEDMLYSEKENNWIDLREFPEYHNEKKQMPVAWCHGAPGVLLSRLAAYKALKKSEDNELIERIEKDIELAKNKTMLEGIHAGYCLCHGNMGNLEILRLYAETFQDTTTEENCKIMLAKIVDMLYKEEILPTEKYNPGFMTGISGMAYSLMRYVKKRLPMIIEVEGMI